MNSYPASCHCGANTFMPFPGFVFWKESKLLSLHKEAAFGVNLGDNGDDFDDEIVYLIDMDEIKKSFPGYSPEMADEFHSESAKIADSLLDENLKRLKNKKQRIIFMSGGSASGKTEFIATFYDGTAIVFDPSY